MKISQQEGGILVELEDYEIKELKLDIERLSDFITKGFSFFLDVTIKHMIELCKILIKETTDEIG